MTEILLTLGVLAYVISTNTYELIIILLIIFLDSYVNARDVGLVHVGAAIDPDVKNERIYAIARHSTWNDHLAIMRKMYPDRKFIDDMDDLGIFSGTVDASLALKLVKKWGGQDDWTSLEQGIKEALDSTEP